MGNIFVGAEKHEGDRMKMGDFGGLAPQWGFASHKLERNLLIAEFRSMRPIFGLTVNMKVLSSGSIGWWDGLPSPCAVSFRWS